LAQPLPLVAQRRRAPLFSHLLAAMTSVRDENVFLARLAEQSNRFDDMVEYMKRVACMGAGLKLEERNLLSAAFKSSLGARRIAWRVLRQDEQLLPNVAATIKEYRATLESELDAQCKDYLDILETRLIPSATANGDPEAEVVYMKMKGDYNRYHAEFKDEASGKSDSASRADAAYGQALDLAKTSLRPAHPIRLGLALNYSVFFHEVLGKLEDAVRLASQTKADAQQDLPSLEPAQQEESQQIVQLLDDNLKLWTADGPGASMDGTAVEDM